MRTTSTLCFNPKHRIHIDHQEGGIPMPRMRLITDAYRQIKEDDPDTALTLNALRCMVKRGDIPCIKNGRKTFINYDALLEYLAS